MTQMTVAPQPLPVIAPAPATAAADSAPGAAADFTGGVEGGADFAAVLKAKIVQPAKNTLDNPETEIFAAQLAAQAAEAAAKVAETASADEQFDASDLVALLAGLMPPEAKSSPAASDPHSGAANVAGAGAHSASIAADTSSSENAPADALFGEDDVPALAQRRQAAGSATPSMHAAPVATLIAPDPQTPLADTHANPATQIPGAAPLTHAASGGDAPAIIRIDTPTGSHGWDAEVGQKIIFLANRQESRAELTLTPPHLGKLEITISVNGDQTSATFISASPAAREALEQALPRLREMLADAGISLGQASVNAESARQGRDEAPATGTGMGHGGRDKDTAQAAEAPTQWLRRSSGLVDTFA